MVAAQKASSSLGSTKETPARKLDVYVIDAGWNQKMTQVIKEHFQRFEALLFERDRVYLLDAKQSTEVLRANPSLVGKDPVVVVLDSDSWVENRKSGRGFRCCLGLMKSTEAAKDMLVTLSQILLDTEKCKNIDKAFRKEIHREGINGAVEIIAEQLGLARRA
jgi:hypothetical protein